uniref:Putative secreted protein n=1 Tax=Amblyomma triste TaxID=251400 RepID=A0A023G501_AMBTT
MRASAILPSSFSCLSWATHPQRPSLASSALCCSAMPLKRRHSQLTSAFHPHSLVHRPLWPALMTMTSSLEHWILNLLHQMQEMLETEQVTVADWMFAAGPGLERPLVLLGAALSCQAHHHQLHFLNLFPSDSIQEVRLWSCIYLGVETVFL